MSSQIKKPIYRMYVDESGDHTFSNLIYEEKRYLGLTGCVIKLPYYKEIFCPEMEKLKHKYFSIDIAGKD